MKDEVMKVGLLYLSLHNQLIKKIGVNRIITRKDFFAIIGRHYLIPKNLRDAAIKEMQIMGLIEKIDGSNYIVLPCDLCIEEDASKFYKALNLF